MEGSASQGAIPGSAVRSGVRSDHLPRPAEAPRKDYPRNTRSTQKGMGEWRVGKWRVGEWGNGGTAEWESGGMGEGKVTSEK